MQDFKISKNYSGEVLSSLRKQARLTQEEMADFFQITQGTYSKVERGKLELSAYQWLYFCFCFKVDPWCLLDKELLLKKDSC